MILRCDDNLRDLQAFRRKAHFRAQRGGHGQGAQRHGADGEPMIVRVPPGTQVTKWDGTRYDLVLPVQVDRVRARFAAWYEVFPRSMSDDAKRHGTFDDVIRKLPYVRDMGFDVLYFPPIHPIGHTKRKGRNNAVVAAEGELGSPWAIGSALASAA